MSRLLLLGSGGWAPTSSRETCCALLRDGRSAIIIDAGTGIHRLIEDPALLDGAESVEIVLTHFHLDHVVGLAYLPALGLRRAPVIHAPGESLYGTSSAHLLRTLLGPPFLNVRIESVFSEVHELWPGETGIGGISVRCRRQDRHSAPTLGLVLGGEFAYCTDTAADEGTAEFVRGARLLAHEAWTARVDSDDELRTHTAARQAGEIAASANVDELVLIHLPPSAVESELLSEADAVFANVRLGRDLDVL